MRIEGLGGRRSWRGWRDFYSGEEVLCEYAALNLALLRMKRSVLREPLIAGKITQNFTLRGAREGRLIFAHGVIPEDLHCRHAGPLRKIKAYDGFPWEVDVAAILLAHTFDRCGRAQPQGHVRRPENVARHIAQRSRAEIEESPPAERQIILAVGPLLRDAQPQVPIERARYWRRSRRFFDSLRPSWAIRPGMHLCDVADCARPDHFRALARAFVRVALISHLRSHAVFLCGLHQLTAFPNGVRQRFLHVDVLARLHSGDCGGGVHVIGNGYDHGIEVRAFFVEHLPVISIFRGFWEGTENLGRAHFVHIAKRHDVFRLGASLDVAGRFAPGSDGCNVELLIR